MGRPSEHIDAAALRRERERRGWSYADMGEALGVSAYQAGAIERDGRTSPETARRVRALVREGMLAALGSPRGAIGGDGAERPTAAPARVTAAPSVRIDAQADLACYLVTAFEALYTCASLDEVRYRLSAMRPKLEAFARTAAALTLFLCLGTTSQAQTRPEAQTTPGVVTLTTSIGTLTADAAVVAYRVPGHEAVVSRDRLVPAPAWTDETIALLLQRAAWEGVQVPAFAALSDTAAVAALRRELAALADSLDAAVRAGMAEIARLQAELSEARLAAEAAAQDAAAAAAARDTAIAALRLAIADRDQALAERDQALVERDQAESALVSVTDELGSTRAALDASRAELSAALSERDQAMAEAEAFREFAAAVRRIVRLVTTEPGTTP